MQQTPFERARIQRDWQARGYSCGLWIDPPGQVWHDFVHDDDEVVLLVEGELQIEMQGRVLRLRPGDEVVIPARTRHTVRNIGSSSARWLYGYRSARIAQ